MFVDLEIDDMALLGDYLALGVLILISLHYFKSKYFLTKASHYYIAAILSSFVWLAIAILSQHSLKFATPAISTLLFSLNYFLVLISTALISLVLIAKILEHVNQKDDLKNAHIISVIILFPVLVLTVINAFTGWIFAVSDDMVYTQNFLYPLGYGTVVAQFVLVLVYYTKFRSLVTKSVYYVLTQTGVVVAFCGVLKFLFPNLLINGIVLTFVEMVIFFNFQNQRVGTNTLTKLNDRRRFFTEIERRIEANENFKIYRISIKDFSIVNHKYGFAAGDSIIYLFAFALERLLDDSICFHMSGTSFSIVLGHTDEEESCEQTKKLMEFLGAGVEYQGARVKLDYIVAEYHHHKEENNANSIYEKLEYSCVIAKENKLDYIFYTEDIGNEMNRRKYITSRLEKIDSEHGFELWFQPIYSVNHEGFTSMEALIRLREADGSFISPLEFIPLAEKNNMIIPITWFVIEQACRTLAQHRELDEMRVSINIPMSQLIDKDFEQHLNRIVDSYNIAHNRISFEFTERVIIEDLTKAEENMRRLSKNGYLFYLDDFGVGYSNFNCVLQLPLKTIKLDMSLTSTIEKIQENCNLVKILIDLFHSMHLNVIAEGAEEIKQVDLLHSYGVDGIQGYYFAKPMPTDALIEFMEKSKNEALSTK